MGLGGTTDSGMHGRWPCATAAEINEAARALYSSTLVRLPAAQLAAIVKYWMRFRTWAAARATRYGVAGLTGGPVEERGDAP